MALFYEEDRLIGAIRALRRAGFQRRMISVSEPEPLVAEQPPMARGERVSSGAISGLSVGAIVGGVFGLLVAIGTLPNWSLLVLRDVAEGIVLGVSVGALLGACIGCIAGWRVAKPATATPESSGRLLSVVAGERDEEAKAMIIQAGGDLSPTNAADALML